MTATVTIKNGTYLNKPITDQTYKLVRDFKIDTRGGYVTVHDGQRQFRVRVKSEHDIAVTKHEPVTESDDVIMQRIAERFTILDDMTTAAIHGDIRAMIVVGPPGVGKSFGVERQLQNNSMFEILADEPVKYEVVKGSISALGLYATLYRHSDRGHVVVFDDCDSALHDEISLNLLKAALDSGRRRRIYWNADSHFLRRSGIPESFDFRGTVIFITNINFDNIKSKKLQDHLAALHSRCHYLDLSINTTREKLLRIKQIFQDGDLFQDYRFDDDIGNEIIDFMVDNQKNLREISLRMALKIADLTKVSSGWRELARVTCMKS